MARCLAAVVKGLKPHLVVGVEHGEVADAQDDLVQQFLHGGVVRAVPDQVAGDVAELQGQALLPQTSL